MKPTVQERLVKLEEQVKRLASDAESEKETRERAHRNINDRLDKFDTRLLKIERTIWIATGGISVLMVVLNFLK